MGKSLLFLSFGFLVYQIRESLLVSEVASCFGGISESLLDQDGDYRKRGRERSQPLIVCVFPAGTPC